MAPIGSTRDFLLNAATSTHRIATLVTAAVLCAAYAVPCAQPAFAADPLIGKPAPEFVRTDLHGRRIDLNRFRGKVVLLNFWATWCGPCQVELPAFVQWQRDLAPRGFAVIGISMDDDAPPVRRLAAKLSLNYPVAMGDAKLGERYGGVLGLPLTYLIDRHGIVRARFQGDADVKAIEAQLKELLGQR